MRRLPNDELCAALLSCITAHKTVQQIFDRVYEITALPMLCFDPSFKLIAASFPRPFYYPHWEWMAEKGSASQENILEYDYLSNQEEMVRSTGALLFNSGTTTGFSQYCGAVMNDGQLMAYCGIMLEDAEPADVKEATDLLIKALSVTMRRDMQDDIAERSIIVDDHLSPPQKETLYRKCSGMYLFVTATCGSNQKSTLQYVRSNLIWKGFRMISCLHGEDLLYILVGQQNGYVDRESFQNALREIAANHGILFGLSDYFSDPEDIAAHRQQAMLALSIAAASGDRTPISYFNDHYSDYICHCAMEYFGTEQCMCPEIRLLQEEDELRGTDYMRTLQVWFDSMRNNAVAAEALDIHQATMINRIKHISAIIGHDLSDYFDSLQLELDMYRSVMAEASRHE